MDSNRAFPDSDRNYFNRLETVDGMKMRPNDTGDWFNTLYVRPDDKYFTRDEKRKKRIKNDPRISHYLFEPSEV